MYIIFARKFRKITVNRHKKERPTKPDAQARAGESFAVEDDGDCAGQILRKGVRVADEQLIFAGGHAAYNPAPSTAAGGDCILCAVPGSQPELDVQTGAAVAKYILHLIDGVCNTDKTGKCRLLAGASSVNAAVSDQSSTPWEANDTETATTTTNSAADSAIAIFFLMFILAPSFIMA